MTLAAQVEHPKMVRMEVRFSPDEMASITAKARRLGISKSEVVRRCLRSFVDVTEPWVSPYEDLIGIIKDGRPTDTGRNHDDYLYPAQPI